MSLRVWLPLTGDLENKGISNTIVSNNGATIDSNGKLGKCYSFNGSSQMLHGTCDALPKGDAEFSICFWMNWTASSWRNDWVGFLTWGSNSLLTAAQAMIMNGRFCLDFWDARYIQNAVTIQQNQWYHIAIVKKPGPIATTCKIYINGVEDTNCSGAGSSSYSPNIAATSTFQVSRAITDTASRYFPGKLNDVRLYDHVLSPLEVKELAQGLVLHYTLNKINKNLFTYDGLTEYNQEFQLADYQNTGSFKQFNNCMPSTNLVDSVGSYFTISLDAISPNGTTSLLIYNANSDPRYFYYSTTLTTSLGNEWQHFTYTFQNVDRGDTHFSTIYHPLEVYMPNKIGGKIRNVKIEFGTAETVWTSYADTSMETTIADCSGYNRNGIIGGALISSNDTPRYLSSLMFNGTNNYVSSPTPNFIKPDRYTMSCWIYTDTIPSNSQYIFNCIGTGGVGLWFHSSKLELKHANAAGSTYVYPYATITTGWHFIAGTFDGSNVKLYVDGVLESTVAANTVVYNSPSWVIGGNAADGYASGDWFNGKISDVRLYATALSEADIINLYKTSARIDNLGNLHNYEVNELSDFLTNVHGYWDWGIYSNYNYGNGGYNSSSGASTYIVGPGLPTRLTIGANTIYLTSPSSSAVLSPLVPTETKKYDVDIRFRAGNLTYQNDYTGFKIIINGTDYFLNDAVNAGLITNLDVGQNPNPTYAEYDLSTFAIDGNASGGKWQSFWVKFRLIKGEFSAIKVGCSKSSKPGDGLTINASIPDLGVGIRTEGKDGTTNFNLTLTESIAQDTDYTLMCNVAGMPKDSSWTFLVGGSTNTDLSINLHEGFNICHFTANVFSFGTNRLILSDTSGPRTSTVTFSKFLLKNDSTSQIINNIVDGNIDNVNVNVKQSGIVNASQFVEGSDKTRFFSGGTAYVNEIKEV